MPTLHAKVLDEFIIKFDNNELDIIPGSFLLDLVLFYCYCSNIYIQLFLVLIDSKILNSI